MTAATTDKELLTCEICGKNFRRRNTRRTPRTCSRECSVELRRNESTYNNEHIPNNSTKADRDRRAAQALRMRNARMSIAQIAETLGVTEHQVKRDISRAVREWVKIPAEAMVDQQRAILLDILRVEYPAAMDTASPRHYQAQDKILECLAHEAKLFGLNAPQKVSLGISEQEFARHAVELLKVTGTRPLQELAAPVLEAEIVTEPVSGQGQGDTTTDDGYAAEDGDEPEPWSNL